MMLGAGLPDSGFDTINLRDDRLPAKPHASALPNRAVASVRLVGPARYPIYETELVMMGKGALAPCPPSSLRTEWWARYALPTLQFSTLPEVIVHADLDGVEVDIAGSQLFA
jgi:hypothetical protein